MQEYGHPNEGGPGYFYTISLWRWTHRIFLPLVMKNYTPGPLEPGIYGRVTQNGSAVSGVPLDLRFYNGSSWSTRASTTTQADGSYLFTGVPSLGSGQTYYVRYLNTAGTLARLWEWHTWSITSYTAGTSVHAGDFDIADITLVSPTDEATVSLPRTFYWTPRPATPSDDYELDLYDPDDGDPWWWTDPTLGYVGSYTLNSLPSGFSPWTEYAWEVWVLGPGGYGVSYEFRYITFSNAGLGVTAPTVPAPRALPEEEEDLVPRP